MRSNFQEKTISLQGIILFCIFLATLNMLNAYYYFVFIAFGLLLFCLNGKIITNVSLVALSVLAVSLSVFSSIYSYSVTSILKAFTYLMCYIIGYSLNSYERFDTNHALKPFYKTSLFVITGSFVHYLLNWITNLSYSSRNTVDFWTKTVHGATGQAPLACLALAVAIACVFSDTSKKVKILSIFVILIAIGYNLILSGRTLFVLLLIVLAVGYTHKIINQKSKKFKSIAIATIVIAMVFVIFYFNLFGAMSKIENTPFYERFFTEDSNMELDEDARMDNKLDYIKNASTYPWGGANMRKQFGWAHDIILDTYDEAGVFAMLAVVVYLFATLLRMKKCLSNKQLPFEFRQVILCIYTILYVQFMVEPIIQGEPWLFSSFCIIDGSVTRLLVDYNAKKLQTNSFQSKEC